MTNQQIDELLQAFEEYSYNKIFEFLKNEELKSQILEGEEFAYFDVQICRDLMSKIQDEGYDYFYSKLFEYPMCNELLVGLTDPIKIKSCLNSKLKLSNSLRTDLLITLNDVDYLDEYIRISGLDNWEIVELIIRFGDVGYMKTCCEGGSIDFDEKSIIKLVKATKEPEYIKKYIDENFAYLSDDDLVELIIATDDIKYIKFFVFRFPLDKKLQLIKATNDIDYIKECIINDKLGLTGIGKEYLINIVNDKDYTKECIFNTSLNLESEQIRRLLLDIKDEEYIRDCLKENKLKLTDKDKVIIITEIFGEKYLIDCIEGKELELPLKVRSKLLLHIRNREYVSKALFDEKLELTSFLKRELILQNFVTFDGTYNDFIIKCIENDKLGLKGIDKVILIEEIKDKKYIRENIISDKLGLSVSDKVDLLVFLGAEDIVKTLENKTLDFSYEDIERLLAQIKDNDFIAKIINDKRYNLPITSKMKLVLKNFQIGNINELPWIAMFIANDDKDILLDKTLNNYKKIVLSPIMTIGMEIESEGDMSSYINKYFDYKKWESKPDRSLFNGVEIVSPILHATDDESKQIYFVCDMLKNVGQTVSDSCGGHIHIGANYLKSKQAWANFFEIYCNTEKVLYAITNEEDKATRKGAMKHAAPMAHKVKEALEYGVVNFDSEEDLDKFILGLKEIQANERYDADFLPVDVIEQEGHTHDRYFGMNLCNLDNAKNTIEFRMPNGTLNPDLWIDNINLLGGIVQVSQEIAEILENKTLTAEQYRKLTLFEKLKEDISDKEKLMILTELIGVGPQNYIKRFNSNIDLVEANKDICERLIDKPLVIKAKPVIFCDEIEKVSGNVSASMEIEAMNKLTSDVQERRCVSVQR